MTGMNFDPASINPTQVLANVQASFAAQSQAMLTLNRQWIDWQQGQLKSMESGLRAAMQNGFSAVEQSMNASYEMSRVLVEAAAAAPAAAGPAAAGPSAS